MAGSGPYDGAGWQGNGRWRVYGHPQEGPADPDAWHAAIGGWVYTQSGWQRFGLEDIARVFGDALSPADLVSLLVRIQRALADPLTLDGTFQRTRDDRTNARGSAGSSVKLHPPKSAV